MDSCGKKKENLKCMGRAVSSFISDAVAEHPGKSNPGQEGVIVPTIPGYSPIRDCSKVTEAGA